MENQVIEVEKVLKDFNTGSRVSFLLCSIYRLPISEHESQINDVEYGAPFEAEGPERFCPS